MLSLSGKQAQMKEAKARAKLYKHVSVAHGGMASMFCDVCEKLRASWEKTYAETKKTGIAKPGRGKYLPWDKSESAEHVEKLLALAARVVEREPVSPMASTMGPEYWGNEA